MQYAAIAPFVAGLALAGLPAGAAPGTFPAPGPPQFVAGPKVVRAAFSPSGRTVFLGMAGPDRLDESAAQPAGLALAPGVQEPDRSVTAVLWSRRTRRAAVVWKAPWKEAWIADVQWLPGAETALAAVHGIHAGSPAAPAAGGAGAAESTWVHLMQFDARGRTAVERATVPGGMGCGIAVSPRQPVAILAEGNTFARTLRIVRPGGMSDPIPVPESAGSVLVGWAASSAVRWSADGYTVYLPSYSGQGVVFSRRPIVPESPEGWVALDTRAAVPVPVKSLLKNVPAGEDHSLPLAVTEDQVPIPGGKAPYVAHPLWLEGGTPDRPRRFLLSTDAVRPVVSPAGDAVLYVENGIALLRPVYRVDATAFREVPAAP